MKLEEILMKNYSTEDELFMDLHLLEFREPKPLKNIEEYPLFIQLILECPSIGKEGKRSFMGRFGDYYLESEKFRKLTDGARFLFASKFNGEYEGCHPRNNDILRYHNPSEAFNLYVEMYPWPYPNKLYMY